MRILFLNPVGVLGGAERVLLDVMTSLRDVLPAGSSMKLICMSAGGLIEEARAIGVETDVLALPERLAAIGESGLAESSLKRGSNTLTRGLGLATRGLCASPAAMAYARRFRAAVKAAGADVIHSNGVKTHLLSRVLPREAGAVVWHIHDLLGGRPLMARLLRYATGHVSAAVAISQAVAVDTGNVLPGVPVFTVLNAVDTEHFSPGIGDGRWLDALAGLPPAGEGTVRVGLVATYARWKGQDVFMEAAARLRASGVGGRVRFYIIGGSIYQTSGSQYSRSELEAQAAALGLNGEIGFVPFQTDTLAVYRALDVVVHASTKPEPFGRTIAEAMACGRAVVVSKAGGAVELFNDGVDAIGAAPGDVEGLCDAVRSLVEDEELRRGLGQAACLTASARFTRPRLGREFWQIYEGVVKARSNTR